MWIVKVFISHSFDNENLAKTLQKILQENGIDAYIAQQKPEYHLSVGVKIRNELHDSDYLVGIITNSGYGSHSVNQEIGYAQGIGLKNISMVDNRVFKRGALTSEYEIEEFDPSNFEYHCKRIVNYIQTHPASKPTRYDEDSLTPSQLLVTKSSHYRYHLEQILGGFIHNYLIHFVKEYADQRGMFSKEERINAHQLFKNELKTQDKFFNKIHEQSIPEIETIYEECNRFKNRLELIEHFPHVDFLPDEQDAFIKLNERIKEITDENEMNLVAFLESNSKKDEFFEWDKKLKDIIESLEESQWLWEQTSVFLMELRFFLKSVDVMFGILQNIRIKYGELAFRDSYDDETA